MLLQTSDIKSLE